MTTLNWTSEPLKPAVSRTGSVVTLTLEAPFALCLALGRGLGSLPEGSEVKVLLPVLRSEPFPVEEEWTLYFKRSTGSDRAMAAHPTEREWVGSLLLSEARLRWLAGRLEAGEAFSLWDAGGFSYPSNLKINFKAL